MENKKREIEDHIRRITAPVFNKVPYEVSKNHMMVGAVTKKKGKIIKKCFYQPHNFRRYYDFNKENFNPTQTIPYHGLDHGAVLYRLINKTEHSYANFWGCRLVVRKTQIEIINKVNPKQWHVLKLANPKYIKEQILNIVSQKEKECITALKEFIKVYGGHSKFKLLNWHSEDKIEHEDMIDLIPIKQKFHNEVVKKVYNQKNVEFSDPVYSSNYLRNRAIEDIAPEIVTAINNLHSSFISPNFSRGNEAAVLSGHRKENHPSSNDKGTAAKVFYGLTENEQEILRGNLNE